VKERLGEGTIAERRAPRVPALASRAPATASRVEREFDFDCQAALHRAAVQIPTDRAFSATANVERVGPDRVGFFYRGMSRSNQGLFVENHSRDYLPIQTTSVRDWIRAVASFRMGISVSEVAFGDVIFPKTARRRLKCPYDSRREARSVKPVSDYLARFERRRCLFRDGMWCYIIA
jgi:hypothetical protein